MPLTSLELKFADGDYLFALKVPQLDELQQKCGAGIFAIYGRVLKGRYVLAGEVVAIANECEAYTTDIYETIRLALIGGGKATVDGKEIDVSALRARELVERYVHPAPLRENWAIAAAILAALIEGYDPGPNVEPAERPATGHRGSKRGSTPKK